MIQVRPSQQRGHADHGWLKTQHSFSFASYWDPKFMGFRNLRVINEDVVAPARGFGKHPHENMEIITYVLSGELQHEDSTGGGGVIRPGVVQAMSAGNGVYHSEINPSTSTPVHLLQIWVLPDREGGKAHYADRDFSSKLQTGEPVLLASNAPENGSLNIGASAKLYAARPKNGARHEYDIEPGHHAWVQVARGTLDVNGTTLNAGDGAAISEELHVALTAKGDSEYLFFELK